MSISTQIKYLRLVSSRLRNFKQKKDNLWNFSCNICGDSQKNHTKARGYVYQKGNDLFYICHNCGASISFGNFIKTIDPSLHKEYVLEQYKSGKIKNIKIHVWNTKVASFRFGETKKQKEYEHATWCNELPKGHFCLLYLEARKIPVEHYDKLLFTSHYKDFVDALIPNNEKEFLNDARLIIPFYDKYFSLIAVSGRALETSSKELRYAVARIDTSNDKLIYGLERVNLNKPVKIVEGPLDSLFLSNCVASGDSNLIATANSIDASSVLIYDNERRNKEIVALMKKAIKENHRIVIWPDSIEAKDINDMIVSGMTATEIENVIENNTFSGIEATLKFNYWKKV